MKKKYEVRVKSPFGSPEHTFVENLRNFSLHTASRRLQIGCIGRRSGIFRDVEPQGWESS